jgi:hypothetical protein
MLFSAKRTLAIALGACALSLGLAQVADAQAGTATIRGISVLGSSGASFELEIAGTQAITPQTRVLTGPDRLVIDFPGALPGRALRNLALNQREVKGVRVGLFENDPPVTRVVLDLRSPQRYQIFPSGRSVIVKLMPPGSANPAAAMTVTAAAPAAPPPPPRPANQLQVQCPNGTLKIVAQRVPLAAVLTEIHRCTGAEISIPSGAQSEEVFANLGPAPARQVLTSLLNGSAYNFIMIGSERDPNLLRSVLISPRGSAGESMPAIVQPAPEPAVAEAPEEQSAPEPPPDVLPGPDTSNPSDTSNPPDTSSSPDTSNPPEGSQNPNPPATPPNGSYPPPPQ